jgi:hypothetical protein
MAVPIDIRYRHLEAHHPREGCAHVSQHVLYEKTFDVIEKNDWLAYCYVPQWPV